MLFKQTQQEVQRLQAFAHSVVTVNNKQTKLGSQESVGVKFKEDICAEFCLKLWFENDLYFCNITQVRMVLKVTV